VSQAESLLLQAPCPRMAASAVMMGGSICVDNMARNDEGDDESCHFCVVGDSVSGHFSKKLPLLPRSEKEDTPTSSWKTYCINGLVGRSGRRRMSASHQDIDVVVACDSARSPRPQSRPTPESKSMDLLDRVPMDFSADHRGGQCGRIITDPEEAKLAELDDALTVKHHIRQTQADGRIPCAIYMSEPWFHQDLTRDETENMFKHCKHKEGTYLVRVSKTLGTFVLSVAHKGSVWHIPVSLVSSNEQMRLSVDGGRTLFRDLIQLIDFYQMNPSDVIPCLLTGHITKAIHMPRFTNAAMTSSV